VVFNEDGMEQSAVLEIRLPNRRQKKLSRVAAGQNVTIQEGHGIASTLK